MRLPSPSAARPTLIMSPLRLALGLLLTTAPALAQSLPATPPTTIPTTIPTTVGTPGVGPIDAVPVPRATRPTVTYADGLLDVRASNASLQQILRIISRQTGMHITGGVQDQRVFGNYGPAEPGTVLATLLDGTGVNILVHEDAAHKPLELILTPRGGGVSPSMASPTPDDEVPEAAVATQPATSPAIVAKSPQQLPSAALPPSVAVQSNQSPGNQAPTGPQSMPQPLNNVLGNPNSTTPTASQIPTTNSVPIDSLPTPSTTTQTAQGIVDSANPPPADTQNTGTPAPATPEQIYQQLLKLQQQKTPPKPQQ